MPMISHANPTATKARSKLTIVPSLMRRIELTRKVLWHLCDRGLQRLNLCEQRIAYCDPVFHRPFAQREAPNAGKPGSLLFLDRARKNFKSLDTARKRFG